MYEMPHTLAALEAGALSEWRATLIVRESACLSIEDRRELDERMCADQSELEGKGDKGIETKAKAIAYELDPQAVVDRAVRAERERTVTIRPAPDNMTIVTVLLPMARGGVGVRIAQACRGHHIRWSWARSGDGRYRVRADHRPIRRYTDPDRGQPAAHR